MLINSLTSKNETPLSKISSLYEDITKDGKLDKLIKCVYVCLSEIL